MKVLKHVEKFVKPQNNVQDKLNSLMLPNWKPAAPLMEANILCPQGLKPTGMHSNWTIKWMTS